MEHQIAEINAILLQYLSLANFAQAASEDLGVHVDAKSAVKLFWLASHLCPTAVQSFAAFCSPAL